MLKTRRAFIRAIKGLPIERQRQMATAAKCGDIYEHGDSGGMDERALWLQSLRADDTAWVPDLRVLLRPKSELGRVRVSSDFTGTIAAICSRRAVVEEGTTGTRSDTYEWANRVQSVVQNAHLASRSTAKINQATKKAREARVGSGLVALWLSPVKEVERRKALVIWQSRSFETAKDAKAALPDDLSRASLPTLQRIFHEGRDPARKGQGGPRSRCKFIYAAKAAEYVKVGIAANIETRKMTLRRETVEGAKITWWREHAMVQELESIIKFRLRHKRYGNSHEQFTLSIDELVSEIEAAISGMANGERLATQHERTKARARDKTQKTHATIRSKATRWVVDGMSLKEVAKRLGHGVGTVQRAFPKTLVRSLRRNSDN